MTTLARGANQTSRPSLGAQFHPIVGMLLRGHPAAADELASRVPIDSFLRWCHIHRLGPLFHRLGAPGGLVQRGTREQVVLAHAEDLARQEWMSRLLELCVDRQLPVWAFKGCGIAHVPAVFACPAERPLGDVDLLIDRSDLDRFDAIARHLGFQRKAPGAEHYQVAYVHPRHGLLEVHHRLYADILPEQEARFRARAHLSEVYGVPVRVFSAPDLFLVLAAHFFRNEEILWIWLVELALLGRVMKSPQWETLRAESRAGAHGVFVETTLASIELLWGITPADLPEHVRRDWTEDHSRLERAARARLLESLGNGAFRGPEILLARRFSGRPFRRQRSLVSRFSPTPDDLAPRDPDLGGGGELSVAWVRAIWLQAKRATLQTSRIARVALRSLRSDNNE